MPTRNAAGSVIRAALALAMLATTLAGASAVEAHGLQPGCRGEFVNLDGHGSGSCLLAFKGLPVGVAGSYDAGTPTGRAEIHVELWAVTATGTRRPLVECVEPLSVTAKRYGTVSCQAERNEAGVPITLIEAIPDEIMYLECEGHSHAPVPASYDRTPSGTFACWSTAEAGGSE